MRTIEECYEYVLKRCDELAAQRRRKRERALKAAAPVCGIIAVIAGAAAVMHSGKANTPKHSGSAENSVISGELGSSVFSAQETVSSAPKHENKLNIGELEIAEDASYYLPMIPPVV